MIVLSFFVFSNLYSQSKYEVNYNKNHLSSVIYEQNQRDGFRISVSVVAMFTTGTSVMDGFRLGAGLNLSQTIGHWTINTGFDTYKAKQSFGFGTLYTGFGYTDNKYEASYYLTKYCQGDKQLLGLLGLRVKDIHIHFEDDILAFPFVGFKIFDRYRSAALEVRYKGFIVGTNVYTTDINGMTDFSSENSKGVHLDGKQLSSPVYLGYSSHDLLFRIGINNKFGGLLGQNAWHQRFFGTPDFKAGNYNRFFLQTGIDKPYTLY